MPDTDSVQKHSFLLRLKLPLIKLLVRLLFLFLAPRGLRIIGRYRVPRRGGLLILANHLSDLDPVVVQLASPRPIHFMAKSELFEIPILGSFMRWFRAFPIRRGEPDKQAIKHAVNLLKAGEAVCIFPEGQLSEDTQLQKILPGAGLIVRMAGKPIICCGLVNTQKIMPYGKVLPRTTFAVVSATWGEQRTFDRHDENEAVIAWIESALRSLSDQSS